jgi:hypothetical protein
VIDRSTARDTPMKPVASLQVARLFGTSVAETILASVPVRAHRQAGHMDASDLIRALQNALRERGPSTYGFTSRCVCNTRSWRPQVCRPTTQTRVTAKAVIVAEVELLRWRIGTARRRMPSAASTGSARSCMSSRVRTATARKACRRASCGTHCTKSTSISVAKVRGWSITPNDIVLVCVSGPRSPRARRTSRSTGG